MSAVAWPVRHEDRADAYRASGAWQGRTIADDARQWAEKAGDITVFLGESVPATYASLLADATVLGIGLRRMGLEQGDVVSFMIPNWVEAAVINLASAVMGFIVNPIVPIYREAETGYILRNCRSRAIFVPTAFRRFDYAAMLGAMRADLPDLRHIITVRGRSEGASEYGDLLDLGRGVPVVTPDVDPSGVKMVMYTSGTTGAPKAVLHSHETLARAVAASARHWAIGQDDVVVMPSPVTHVSGYSNGLERPFLGGTRTVLMESWNADAAVDLIDRHKASMTVAATPFLQELIGAAQRAGSRLESFRVFACGGAAVPPEVIRKANAAFAHPCAFRVYGSSEAPFVTLGAAVGDNPLVASETDGRVVDYDVRLIDDDGRDVVEGEIVVRGPALFLGYGEAVQTADSFTADGYFETGDIGRYGVDGGLIITGRKKDIIIRGGENISAKEIEDALHLHPDIVEAAVVSAPHERLGEGIFAFLIVRPGASLTLADLGDFLWTAGLARQKCPEGLALVGDLPRTASGKVRKDQLRARLAFVVAR
ncbi:MAG: AMP-binding protein [Sphingobium sp.]|nr:AMP-binding protein [Sphingobium sp.]